MVYTVKRIAICWTPFRVKLWRNENKEGEPQSVRNDVAVNKNLSLIYVNVILCAEWCFLFWKVLFAFSYVSRGGFEN